jgi:hypothetical protein
VDNRVLWHDTGVSNKSRVRKKATQTNELPGKIAARSCNHCCRSCNHFCRWKTITIAYSDYVFVAPFIQLAKRTLPIVLQSARSLLSCKAHAPYCPLLCGLCGLSASTTFLTLSHKRYDFRGEKNIEHKMYFDFLYKFCLMNFSF